MEPYNLKHLSTGLQEAAKDIRGKDITRIAAVEQIDQTTVREYLKGHIAKPAMGKAILGRCREILIARTHDMAA